MIKEKEGNYAQRAVENVYGTSDSDQSVPDNAVLMSVFW